MKKIGFLFIISLLKNKKKFIKEISLKSTSGTLNQKDCISFYYFSNQNKKKCIKGISLQSTSVTLNQKHWILVRDFFLAK